MPADPITDSHARMTLSAVINFTKCSEKPLWSKKVCPAAHTQRLLVKPGITGLAQIQLPPDTDLDSVRRKLAHDLHYVNRMGVWLDLRILFATAFQFLGLPTHIFRKALLIPGGPTVERPYSEAASRVGFTAELQPT